MYGALVMPSLVLDVIPAYMSCGPFKPQDLSGLIGWAGCELQQTIHLQLTLSSNVNIPH